MQNSNNNKTENAMLMSVVIVLEKRILGAIRNVSPDKERLSSFLIGCIVHVVT